MQKFTLVLPTEEKEETEKKQSKKSESIENQHPAAGETTLLPDTIVDEDDDEVNSGKGVKMLIVIALLVIAGLICMRIFMKYDEWDVRSSVERDVSVESKYIRFKDNLIRYSTNGIFYTSMSGSLIWNYTYDMTNPSIEIKGNSILVFDKNGNNIVLLNEKGLVTSQKMKMPIIDASVSAQDSFAILLQENNVSYIKLYDRYGELVAEGEIHPENGGFPVSIAYSPNGIKLAISMINMNAGTINTTIDIFDYGKAGAQASNNTVASYSYPNVLVPELYFGKHNNLIAFGDNQIVLYDNDDSCSIKKNIASAGQIRSIFYNQDHFGYIYETENEEGQVVNKMDLYNYYGFRNFSKDINESYETVYIMDNNEVVLADAHNISIYNKYGTNRFKGLFDANIYKVMPGSMLFRYYLIEETYTEEISIK